MMPPAYLPHTARGWLVTLAIAVAMALGWMAYTHQNGMATAVPLTAAPRVGYLAPDFTLPTLNGETLTLSDLRGRPVVLNFWASWCGPCRVETPHFQTLSQQYASQVAIIGINQQETADIIQIFADQYALTYPLLIDADAAVNQTYAIFGLPTTLFIGANGVIRHITPGAISQAVLENQIQALLEE